MDCNCTTLDTLSKYLVQRSGFDLLKYHCTILPGTDRFPESAHLRMLIATITPGDQARLMVHLDHFQLIGTRDDRARASLFQPLHLSPIIVDTAWRVPSLARSARDPGARSRAHRGFS